MALLPKSLAVSSFKRRAMRVVCTIFFCLFSAAALSASGRGPDGTTTETTFVFRLRGMPSSEAFRIRSSSAQFIAEARSELALPASRRTKFPNGKLAAGDGGTNLGWSWHFESAEFTQLAIELCDGTPSYVEAHLSGWLKDVGNFCPWSAYVYAELE